MVNAEEQSSEGLARIAIDRGGTFTDAICSRPGKEDIVVKASQGQARKTRYAAVLASQSCTHAVY